jgi:steroid 5-alpha reductase family enzyme
VLATALVACAGLAAACWLLGVATREVSWVDRLWSLAPPLYVAWFAWSAARLDGRLVVMTALAALWGARLTYNFARKGGYARGGEDYRWAELRKTMGAVRWQLFSLVFISAYQNLLLLLIALPAWAVARRPPAPFGPLDVLATALFLLFLAGETVADQQQWRFQEDKKARRRRGEPVEHEFLTTGLFRFSRHPAFFCEIAIWWSFYLFSVAAGARWLDPSILGAALLTLLFQGSTAFTESITLRRYPAYAAYQSRVSRLFPLPPRR